MCRSPPGPQADKSHLGSFSQSEHIWGRQQVSAWLYLQTNMWLQVLGGGAFPTGPSLDFLQLNRPTQGVTASPWRLPRQGSGGEGPRGGGSPTSL